MDVQKIITHLKNAIAALENGDSITAYREMGEAQEELNKS